MLNFLGIGAQKAGTTWLYRVLSEHPDISFPAGKEVHFWDNKYEHGIGWYRALFPDTAEQLQGEITPAYSILSPFRIAEVRNAFPDLRLIYILRNPIERAWSSALMALHRAEMLPHEASDQWFIDHFLSDGSIQRGNYKACIENWLTQFPRNQLGLYFFDDLKDNPEKLITYICNHLDLSPEPLLENTSELLHIKVRPIRNASKEPIRPSLLPVLRKIYMPKIRQLELFFERRLDCWLPCSAS